MNLLLKWYFFRWLPSLFCLVFLVACGSGTRYIFSSSSHLVATPATGGLDYQEAWFPADDGVRLHGWLIPGAPDKPLVLFFHGNAANISHRVDNLAHLHSLGFPVFIFDYRGFGRSEGKAAAEADLTKDARGALAWLAEQGWAPGRMIYFGRSMGAAVAVALALETPPAGVVLEAPFTSLPAIARRMTPVTWTLVGWWSIDDRFDNLGRIDRLGTPLLIFHGDRDTIIPVEMSRQLYKSASQPKTLQIIQGAGHSDCYAAGGDVYQRAWLDFADSLATGRLNALRPQADTPIP